MINKYKRRLFFLLILIGFFITSYKMYIPPGEENSNIEINNNYKGDNFNFFISQSLYYPAEETLYIYYKQELTNPIYIGKGNNLNIYTNFGEKNEEVIISEQSQEGSNSVLINLTNEEYENMSNIYVQFKDLETDAFVYGGIEFKENMVSYEDLSNYSVEPKTTDEKQREISYFKYLYTSDALWEIKLIDSVGIDMAFKGNIRSQHKFLVEVLDSEAYTESKSDDVFNYFKEVIDEDYYKAYFESTAKSEKQAIYNNGIDEMIKRLNSEINKFEFNLTSTNYMTDEEIKNNTAGMNILEKYRYLREKNDRVLFQNGIDEVIIEGTISE